MIKYLRNRCSLILKILLNAFLLVFFSLKFNASAQEGNVWIFGYRSSLDFNNSPPLVNHTVPLIQRSNSSASICDSLGNLLLYTDGFSVYNAKHQLIGNGLYGSELSNQGVLILPINNNPNLYILLTISDNSKSPKGLYFHIADLSSQSLLVKNKLLASDLFLNITAILHTNGKNQWIIAKKYPDTFYVFQLVNDIISSPVKVYFSKPSVYRPVKPYHSYLSPSFNGKTLVESCYFMRDLNTKNSNYASYIYFYDFNPETGQLTNRQVVSVSTEKENGYPKHQYNQAAFSPNDSLIYITDLAIYPRSAPLIQLNRHTFTMHEISSSVKDEALTAIKTGPDGKIYITYLNRPYLAIIHNPNKSGNACQYRDNYIKINEKNFLWLSFPNNYFKPTQIAMDYQLRCDSTVELRSKSDTVFFTRFIWIFPNGDTAVGKKCIYKFGKSGWHTIRLRAETDYGYKLTYSERILLSNRHKAEFGFDSNIACQWNEFSFKDLSKTEILKSKESEKWTWYFGDGNTSTSKNPVHVYTKPGKYTVSLIYENGFCKDTIRKDSIITILEAAKPGFRMSHENYCAPYLLQISDETKGIVVKYLYHFGDGGKDSVSSPSHYYNSPGNYLITQYLTSPNGCVTKTSKSLSLSKGFSGNEQTQMLTSNIIDNQKVEIKWLPLSHATAYQVLKSPDKLNFQKLTTTNHTFYLDKYPDLSGKIYYYCVVPLDACERKADTSEMINFIFLKGESSSIDYSILHWNDFEGWQQGVKEYILETKNENGVFEPFATTSSSPFRDDQFFKSSENLEKCYRIRAVERDGMNQQSVSNEICLKYETFIYIPNAFSPNGDGINDSFLVIGMCIKNLRMTVMNAWGEIIFKSSPEQLYWDGTYKGEPVITGTYAYVVQATTVEGKILNIDGLVRLIR